MLNEPPSKTGLMPSLAPSFKPDATLAGDYRLPSRKSGRLAPYWEVAWTQI